MDWLHLRGVDAIASLQDTFQGYSELMMFLSHVGDPRNAFLVFFPLSFFISTRVGIQVMWLASVSEWLNAILKWILHGHRPYWWIHEGRLYDNALLPQLKQYRLSCETGPGSPSGHCMITAAVVYVMVAAMTRHVRAQHHILSNNKSFVCRLLWVGFLLLMAAVAVSRCFIATHFPHQVVVGTITGVLIGMASEYIPTARVSVWGYLLVSTLLLVSGPIVYWLFAGMGVDLLWSVEVAKKWCENADWIHMDTTPFFAMTRDASALMGLGAGLYITGYVHTRKSDPPTSILYKVIAILLSVLLTRSLEYCPMPQNSLPLFYTLAYVRNLFFPVVIICIIPKLCAKLAPSEKFPKKAR